MVGKRSLRIFLTRAGRGPVADLEVGVKDQIGRTGLEAGLSVLTFVILPTVAGIGVKFIAGPCNYVNT